MTQFAVLNSTRKAGNNDMLHMYTLHAYKSYLEMSLSDMHGHTWINVPYSFDKEKSIIFCHWTKIFSRMEYILAIRCQVFTLNIFKRYLNSIIFKFSWVQYWQIGFNLLNVPKFPLRNCASYYGKACSMLHFKPLWTLTDLTKINWL